MVGRRRAGISLVTFLVLCGGRAMLAQPDLGAARAAIMEADRQFNQAVADRDRERFLSFVLETAVFNAGLASEMHGHAAIAEGWAAFFAADGPTLTWDPTDGAVLVGGDVGYTVGRWVRRGRGPDGQPSEARGQYLTTWLKQADGAWKVASDIGSTAP